MEIPSDWKITFGYVNPAKAEGGYSRGEGHCLRIYEGKTAKSPLRAVIDSVFSIRDLSIPVAKKIEKEMGESQWTSDSAGNFERHIKVETDHELLVEEIDDDYEFNGQ
jgi:hypothetical protein